MLKGGKTAIVAILLTIVGALQGLDWATLVTDPSVAGWIVSGIGIVMFVLRAVTDTPLFKSEPEVIANP